MGLVKRAADLAYTFRFIRMLVLDWKDWDAFKEGIIDADGKRDRNVKIESDAQKSAYTPFIKLCANIKRLISKVPGGGSKLGSFVSALYLIKEKYNLKDCDLEKIIEKSGGDVLDIINEGNEWFLLENNQVAPGVYRIRENKLLNKTCDEIVWAKDQVRIKEECFPVGDVMGIQIYEATHVKTNQSVYVTLNELYK
jgi:hypothetical protein